MKRLLFLVLAVGAVAGGAWLFFGRAVDVETVAVSKGTLVRSVEEDGYVEAPDDRKIYATQLARVVEVTVEAGDSVVAGQVLARMSNPDLAVREQETRTLLEQAAREKKGAASRLRSAGLVLEDANRNAERWERLYRQEVVSLSELEEARLARDRASEAVAEARYAESSSVAYEAGLRRTLSEIRAKGTELVVKSPISGIVLDLPAEKDRVFQPGELVAAVGPSARMQVVSDVLSDAMGNVRLGQTVRVSAPVLGSSVLEGKLAKIYPQAEEKISALGVRQRRVKVEIDLPFTPRLKPGFEVRVAIETALRREALLLPVEAVRTAENGDRLVLFADGGRVRYRAVKTGLTDRRFVEILEGISEGDRVVRDAGVDLEDGARIRLQR